MSDRAGPGPTGSAAGTGMPGSSDGIGALFIHGTASSGRIWAKLLASPVSLADEPGQHSAETPTVASFGHIGDQDCGRVSLRSILDGPILAPDTPGMGNAQVPSDLPLTFGYWLAHFRRLAGCRRTHLVGHSLGGAIAVHLALEPWVESVTLISPATREYCEDRLRDSPFGANPGTIAFSGPLGRLVSDPKALSRDDARMLREDYARALPLLAKGVPWPPFPLKEASYLSGRRVLLIYGEDDALIPERYFARLGDELESAPVDVFMLRLQGCGHIPQLERPGEVAAALARFWNST